METIAYVVSDKLNRMGTGSSFSRLIYICECSILLYFISFAEVNGMRGGGGGD